MKRYVVIRTIKGETTATLPIQIGSVLQTAKFEPDEIADIEDLAVGGSVTFTRIEVEVRRHS